MVSLEYSLMKYMQERLKREKGVELLGNVRHERMIFPANEKKDTIKTLKCTFHPNLLESCTIVDIPAKTIIGYLFDAGFHGYTYYDNDMLIVTVYKVPP